MAAASCQICGDRWAATYAGYKAEIFVCKTCDAKLSEWDKEREIATLCQVCCEEPAISLHESSQLRCCFGCSAWLSEGGPDSEPTGAADPWDEDGKLGHIFETGNQFDGPDAIASLCGAKAPTWPIRRDMTMPGALRRWGLCVDCLHACPDPAGLADRDKNYFAYVVPAKEIASAVGTS